ncbi:MAG: DUF4330 family protein [Acidobacteriota bacterium]
MPIVDDRGRLWGKVNLVDLAVAVFVLLLVPVAYSAYVLFRTPPPTIAAVEPAVLQEGKDLRVKLTGTNFRPFLQAAVGPTRAPGFLVESPEVAEVRLPDLAPGTYDLVLYDEAREVGRRPGAITILGPPVVPQPTIALRVSGAFTLVPEALAQRLTVGTRFPESGDVPTAQIVELGPAEPAVVHIVTASGVLPQRIPGMVRAFAVLRVVCAPQGEACKVGDVAVTPGATITVPAGANGLPFQILDLGSSEAEDPLPAAQLHRTLEVQVRFATSPEAVPLLRRGARDTDQRLITSAGLGPAATLVAFEREQDIQTQTSVDWSGANVKGAPQVYDVPRRLAIIRATLTVPVERALNEWRYKGTAVKLGAPFGFEGHFYSLRGWILDVKAGETRSTTR